MTSEPVPSTDETLTPFLAPTFSASAYLNSILPPWTPSTSANTSQASTTTPLATLAHEAQDHLARLAASLTRLTNTLNALTDDILRSGGRLAYEVEVLRGDVGALGDALTSDASDGLRADFARLGVAAEALVPPGHGTGIGDSGGGSRRTSRANAPGDSAAATAAARRKSSTAHTSANANATMASSGQQQEQQQQQQQPTHPDYIRTLRILTRVRANLDRVVAVFGAATEWAHPPPASSMTSDPPLRSGNHASSESDDPGREYAARVRDEVALLLEEGAADVDGLEAAARRVQELRELAGVWRGTGEERARGRFVDGLERMVEEERERRGGGDGVV